MILISFGTVFGEVYKRTDVVISAKSALGEEEENEAVRGKQTQARQEAAPLASRAARLLPRVGDEALVVLHGDVVCLRRRRSTRTRLAV